MEESNVVFYVMISILIMVVIALSFIWFLNHAQKKIIAVKLKEQEMIMEHQKALLLNTIITKEKERNRISKELHDDVCSKLGIINLTFHALKSKIDIESNEQLVQQIDQILASSSERARSISHELMPLSFKKFGLHNALKEFESRVNLLKNVTLSIHNDYLIKIEGDLKNLHIYRIIQELINNTLKYADAKKITINFDEEGHVLILRYKDDGKGVDLDTSTPGLGISNIETRVTLLEGTFDQQSSLGQGYEAIIKFPNYD